VALLDGPGLFESQVIAHLKGQQSSYKANPGHRAAPDTWVNCPSSHVLNGQAYLPTNSP